MVELDGEPCRVRFTDEASGRDRTVVETCGKLRERQSEPSSKITADRFLPFEFDFLKGNRNGNKKTPGPWSSLAITNLETWKSASPSARRCEASKHLDVRRPCCAVHAPMIRSSVTAFSTRGRKNRPGPGGPRVRYHWIFSSGNSCNSFKDFRPMLIYVDIRYLYIYIYIDLLISFGFFWYILLQRFPTILPTQSIHVLGKRSFCGAVVWSPHP